jgi:hypothetical protein
MARSQPRTKARTRRGTLARPLDALIFLLPLIIFYEVASLARQDRVIAFDFLRRFFQLFGQVGMWAPGLAVIVILLATHVAAGDKWSIQWRRVGWMYVESVALSVPLLLLNWAVPLAASTGGLPPLLDRVALSIGAGVYEELVFRLILISVMVMIGVDLLQLDRAHWPSPLITIDPSGPNRLKPSASSFAPWRACTWQPSSGFEATAPPPVATPPTTSPWSSSLH